MPSSIRLEFTGPQYDFITATEEFPCFCGGFGAGKTAAAIARAIRLKFQYPKNNLAYYMPTYDLVRQTAFPRFEEAFDNLKVRVKPNRGDNWISVAGDNGGKVIFRTMDQPARIVSFEVADSLVDELDTLKPEDASNVWNKIISRNRQKKADGSLNTVGVATTPEGFRFVYDRWQKNRVEGYRLIRAPTRSNARNLPKGYIRSLENTYPAAQLLAYLEGEFVNLTAGSVYPEFDRKKNSTSEAIQGEEPLHIGMDFNVGKMAAAIHVLRNDEPRAVEERVNVLDTPAMAALLKRDFPKNPILVYPDASGKARKSNDASVSDLKILQEAGFRVCSNLSNPAVKDRVLAFNASIHKAGKRTYLVNTDKCPILVESLEKQPYDKYGEPDKAGGFDHIIDAAGYFVCYRWPIVRPVMKLNFGFAR